MTDRRLFADDEQPSAALTPPSSGVRRVPGQLVIEPLGEGVRVSARDSDESLLWGMVCTKLMLQQSHGSVALYDHLRDLISDDLSRMGKEVPATHDVVDAALDALARLEEVVAAARKNISVKKVTPETRERAQRILRTYGDAYQMITTELPFGSSGSRDDLAQDG
jgi:hypothetical protein